MILPEGQQPTVQRKKEIKVKSELDDWNYLKGAGPSAPHPEVKQHRVPIFTTPAYRGACVAPPACQGGAARFLALFAAPAPLPPFFCVHPSMG